MALDPAEREALKAELLREVRSTLLRPSVHENSDHLDRGLIPRKIAPGNSVGASGTSGQVLTVGTDGYAGWAQDKKGQVVSGGYVQASTFTVSGAPTAITHSITVTGDGVNYMWVEAHISRVFQTGAAYLSFELYDNTVGAVLCNAVGYFEASTYRPLPVASVRIAPFTGTKQIGTRFYTSGNMTAESLGNGTAMRLRATWDGPNSGG